MILVNLKRIILCSNEIIIFLKHWGLTPLPAPLWLLWFSSSQCLVSGRAFQMREVHSSMEFPDSLSISQPRWPQPQSGRLPKTTVSSFFNTTPPPSPPPLKITCLDLIFWACRQYNSKQWQSNINMGHIGSSLAMDSVFLALCCIQAADTVWVAPSGSGQRSNDLHIHSATYLTEQVEAYLMHPN